MVLKLGSSIIDDEGQLWFFTKEHSEKVDELKVDSLVNLAYSDPGSNTYVALNGTAAVVNDREKIKKLWNPFVKAWFPKGEDDPDVRLLRVTPNGAEYWDSNSNKMVMLFEVLKASLTGKPYSEGAHGTLNL